MLTNRLEGEQDIQEGDIIDWVSGDEIAKILKDLIGHGPFKVLIVDKKRTIKRRKA